MPDDLQNWRFNILVNPILKNIILKEIFENNLFASSHYISMAKPWKGQTKANSEYFAERIINLFNDLYYDEYKAVKTVELIKKCCENDNN